MKTIVETYQRLSDIDLRQWHHDGVRCLLLDVDGTLTAWLDSTVPAALAQFLRQARQEGMLDYIGLTTNSHPRQVERLRSIANSCGADAFFIPDSLRERKPSPRMLQKAMAQFGVKPEQTALVGDKYTADVVAARRAGLARVGWVDRLGNADHPFDRYVRRPLEKPLRWKYRKHSPDT